jgi:hypothetical protein
MKTFQDLKFKPHRLTTSYPDDLPDTMGFKNMVQATLKFDDANHISVVGGGTLYGDGVDTFEAMVSGPHDNGDVYGYQTKDEITELMLKIQNAIVSSRTINKHKMII